MLQKTSVFLCGLFVCGLFALSTSPALAVTLDISNLFPSRTFITRIDGVQWQDPDTQAPIARNFYIEARSMASLMPANFQNGQNTAFQLQVRNQSFDFGFDLHNQGSACQHFIYHKPAGSKMGLSLSSEGTTCTVTMSP